MKPPNFRKAISTQTSNPGSDYDSDFTPAGEISISIKTDPPGHQLQAIRKTSTGTKVVVDVTDEGRQPILGYPRLDFFDSYRGYTLDLPWLTFLE